jgi:hypothetical protein
MSIKTLLLAGVLSIAAASAAQAGGKVVGSNFRGHTNMAPAGGTARSGQIPGFGGKPVVLPALASTGTKRHRRSGRAAAWRATRSESGPDLAASRPNSGGDINL